MADPTWECIFCTFANQPSQHQCELCHGARPKSTLPQLKLNEFGLPVRSINDTSRPSSEFDRGRGRGRGRGSRGRDEHGRAAADASSATDLGSSRGRGRGRKVGPVLQQPLVSDEQSADPHMSASDDHARAASSAVPPLELKRPERQTRPKRRIVFASAQAPLPSASGVEQVDDDDDPDAASEAFVASASGKRVLCVAEKPSIAQTVAEILSHKNYSSRRKGGTPVHEFNAKFRGVPSYFKVTSVTGHVYSTDFVPGYEWNDKTDPVSLFAAPVRKVPADKKGSICRHLQREARGMDVLVLWLDCDAEGENICFEVIENTERFMRSTHNPKEQRIFRARFSALTAPDILAAMQNLGSPDENVALSVDARQELDLRMGVAFTRFQSDFFQRKYGDLKSRLVSFGPCQTPTLGFCVTRHDEIQTFVPEKYWVVVPKVTAAKLTDLQNKMYTPKTVSLEWERVRVFSRDVCKWFHDVVSSETVATIIKMETKKKKKIRPTPLNTVELLKIASSKLNIGPGEAMHHAESLYIQGFISYPRTETTAYPANFDLSAVVREHTLHPLWGSHCETLLNDGLHAPKQGVDVGDHPPITPMRCATEADVGSVEAWRLYNYICRHFLGTISPDCTFSEVTASFMIGSETFSATSKKPVQAGFTSVMDWLAVKEDPSSTIEGEVGDQLTVLSVEMSERRTSAPDYLTESDLIGLMEKHGIGTDASISTHISAIVDRNFVQLGPSRTLIPQPLGIVLIHGYYKIDPDLAIPTMRAAVEKQLGLIAKGVAEYEHVIDHFIEVFARKFHYFVAKIGKMDALFEQHFSTLEETSGKALSKCGKCHKWLKYIAMKPSRLYCATCDETYSLPQNGTIKLFMEKTCPLDDFELVMYSTGGANGIAYPLCPYCYNYPPFEDIAKRRKVMACNNCPHPTCKNSMIANGVTECPEHETCKGLLVFDATSGPNWKVICNSCNYLMHFAEKAHKVLPQKQRCEECDARLFQIDFHKNHTPAGIHGDGTLRTGCLFCDPVLSSTTDSAYGHVRKKRSFGGKRGRGRGRGRGASRGAKPSVQDLLNHHG